LDKDIIYWIWMQQALGYANPKVKDVLKRYGTPMDFYKLLKVLTKSKNLTLKEIKKAKDASLEDAKLIFEDCKKLGCDIITFDDELYPEDLRHIYNPPCLLYTLGNMPNLNDEVVITIVGSRISTKYGNDLSYEFAYNLSKSGALVASGGAYGIDTMALKGCLESNGTPICVIGNGLDIFYPKENTPLFNEIIKYGVIISEYPPKVSPKRIHFPQRNRIMSGISAGTLVVEAQKRSGSLITANLALEQGKDVFAIPGDIRSELSSGTNSLIKSGATPVFDVGDIVDEYIDRYPGKLKLLSDKRQLKAASSKKADFNKNLQIELCRKDNIEDKDFTGVSEKAQSLYKVLNNIPKHIDDISREAEIEICEVQSYLLELELLGFAKPHSGARYSIK
jgi:DNA processing protein